MAAYCVDLSWLTEKNRSINQKAFKQKGNKMFEMCNLKWHLITFMNLQITRVRTLTL